MYNGDALTVTLDEQAICVIPNERALWSGWEIRLPDGSNIRLEMQLDDLCISHNGKMLHDTAIFSGALIEASSLRFAVRLIWCIGLYAICEGMMRIALNNSPNPADLIYLPIGIAYVLLANRVLNRSIPALTVVVAGYSLETAILILFMIRVSFFAIGLVLIHIVLIIPIIRGFAAIKRLNRIPSIDHS